jgi:predicted dehydrogenase
MSSPLISRTLYRPLTRRHFIRRSGLAGIGALTGPYILRAAALNSKLDIAVIGAGGKGSSDTDHCASENIVALCDVDQTTLLKRHEKYPQAVLYRDYRRMLEGMKSIDAVIVSGPDHMHAPASIMAMKMGKHVYCQKPLTHLVSEARLMREVAAKYNVATQMGNQGSATDGLRRAVEVVQSGAIGPVREVHVWSNRPIWPQGLDRPTQIDPVPSTLDWDLWIGPAPMRPYVKDTYHPFKWRGWLDFGTGALGDMACHTANMPFRALKLGYPTSVEAKSSGINRETYPKSSEIHFAFPARENMPPVHFVWYDGGNKPSDDIARHVLDHIVTQKDRDGNPRQRKLPGSGCLLIGDGGQLYSPDDYGARYFLLPQKNFEGYQGPTPWIPRLGQGDADRNQHLEWIAACKGGPPGYSNFEIAAYLTEIILLGCVALQVGKRIEWDGPRMHARNAPEAARFVRADYRRGWRA